MRLLCSSRKACGSGVPGWRASCHQRIKAALYIDGLRADDDGDWSVAVGKRKEVAKELQG